MQAQRVRRRRATTAAPVRRAPRDAVARFADLHRARRGQRRHGFLRTKVDAAASRLLNRTGHIAQGVTVRWPADESGDGSNRPLAARPSSLPTRRQVEREAVVAACLGIETWEAGAGRADPERHRKTWGRVAISRPTAPED